MINALYRCCYLNDKKQVNKILQKFPDIDILSRDASCFKILIKHSNVSLLEMLVEHYKSNIKGEPGSIPYLIAMHKLKSSLRKAEAEFGYNVTKEMEQFLDSYTNTIDFDESDKNSDIDGFSDASFDSFSSISSNDFVSNLAFQTSRHNEIQLEPLGNDYVNLSDVNSLDLAPSAYDLLV
ncbi:MAG: hypothetical protein DGJ47_001119 [Rickettsiaceae bacterium]